MDWEQFVDGTFEGEGTETSQDGTYIGAFRAGHREGVGERTSTPVLAPVLRHSALRPIRYAQEDTACAPGCKGVMQR
jgi:hypothetical protein